MFYDVKTVLLTALQRKYKIDWICVALLKMSKCVTNVNAKGVWKHLCFIMEHLKVSDLRKGLNRFMKNNKKAAYMGSV